MRVRSAPATASTVETRPRAKRSLLRAPAPTAPRGAPAPSATLRIGGSGRCGTPARRGEREQAREDEAGADGRHGTGPLSERDEPEARRGQRLGQRERRRLPRSERGQAAGEE